MRDLLLPAELTSFPVSLIDWTVLVFPAGVAQLFPHRPLEKSLQIININNLALPVTGPSVSLNSED